ncbi:unnamed protein product [Amaranthus hypochondriacus]
MSTPPVLSKATGTCTKYEHKCIGHTQKTLFYTGLALLATGMATCLTSLRPYIFERTKKMGIKKPKHIWNIRQTLVRNKSISKLKSELGEVKSNMNPTILWNMSCHWPSEFWLYRCNASFTAVLLILVFWAMPWSFRLGIPVIILFMSTLLFVVKPWYRVIESQGVSTNTEDTRKPVSLIKNIVGTLVYNFPMWSTFVIGGLVSSVGNTYFIEQTGQMDPQLGHWKFPPAFFLIFYKIVNLSFMKICKDKIISNTKISKSIAPFALGVSILCCIIAAIVEKTRLDVVKKHGLKEKTDDSIPLSMFLMLPQFFLLGIFDGSYICCVFNFFQTHAPKSLKKYLNSLMHFVLGLGIICNMVSIYLAGKISGRGTRQSWFQHTLNKSRLDYYYWVLAVLSTINLVVHLIMGFIFSKFKRSESGPESQQPENEDNVEELEFKRLDWFDLLPLRQ